MSTLEIPSAAPTLTDPFRGAKLHIDFDRICPNDKVGMVNIECDGPQGWSYANIGTGHGAQVCEGVDQGKVLAFGDAMSKLVTEFFGDVRPLLDRNV